MSLLCGQDQWPCTRVTLVDVRQSQNRARVSGLVCSDDTLKATEKKARTIQTKQLTDKENEWVGGWVFQWLDGWIDRLADRTAGREKERETN